MLSSLFSVFIVILWIVLGTSRAKIHPFLVLLSAALLLGFLLGIPAVEILNHIQKGFGGIVQSIGLLILFGTTIGVSLERSKGTLALAQGVLSRLHRLPLPYAVSCIGYLVSIPVFCDAAFVILSHLNKTLSKQTRTPLVGLTVALSTGLFAPHVLVPPTPGPLAAASNLALENLFFLICVGASIALILILVGGAYGNYLIRKNPYVPDESEEPTLQNTTASMPSFGAALQPILVPILLMGLGALIKFIPRDLPGLEVVTLLCQPTVALGIGMFLAFRLVRSKRKMLINLSIKEGIVQAAPILIITGMGGALGNLIQTIPLQEYAQAISSYEALGLFIPFGIAALLKTAQGSSTVAIITTSSIVFPLLPLLQLDSEMGKVWVIMALGVGAMTVSHANDSYFWIVSQMSGMDVKTAYRTHTVGTLIQGLVGFLVVFVGYSIWKVL